MAKQLPTVQFQGRLVAARRRSGEGHWLKLEIPQALASGLLAGMPELGVERSPGSAHITVMSSSEVAQIGGSSKIRERGQLFDYTLGSVRRVNPLGWQEMDQVYFITCNSPQLSKFRSSYGLTPLMNNHRFHITFGVRRQGVLRQDRTSKQSGVDPRLLQIAAMTAAGGGLGLLTDKMRQARNEDVDEKRRQSFVERYRNAMLGSVLGATAGGYLSTRRPPQVEGVSDPTPEDDIINSGQVSSDVTRDTGAVTGSLPEPEGSPAVTGLVPEDPAEVSISELLSRARETYAIPDSVSNTELVGMARRESSLLDAYPALRDLDAVMSPSALPATLPATAAAGAIVEPAIGALGRAAKVVRQPAETLQRLRAFRPRGVPAALGSAAAGTARAVGRGAVTFPAYVAGATAGDVGYKAMLRAAGEPVLDDVVSLAAGGRDLELPSELIGRTGVGLASGVASSAAAREALRRGGLRRIGGAALGRGAGLATYLATLAAGGASDVGQLAGGGQKAYLQDVDRTISDLGKKRYGSQVASLLMSPRLLMRMTGAMLGDTAGRAGNAFSNALSGVKRLGRRAARSREPDPGTLAGIQPARRSRV